MLAGEQLLTFKRVRNLGTPYRKSLQKISTRVQGSRQSVSRLSRDRQKTALRSQIIRASCAGRTVGSSGHASALYASRLCFACRMINLPAYEGSKRPCIINVKTDKGMKGASSFSCADIFYLRLFYLRAKTIWDVWC